MSLGAAMMSWLADHLDRANHALWRGPAPFRNDSLGLTGCGGLRRGNAGIRVTARERCKEREGSVFCGRLGLLGVTADDVEPHNEFLGTEDHAVDNPGSRLQVAHYGFHLHVRTQLP